MAVEDIVDEPLGQVPRSQRIGDRTPGQGGFYESMGSPREDKPAAKLPGRLLTGRDEVKLNGPVEVALAIVKESLVDAFRIELDVERPPSLYPVPSELETDPERVAEHMLQEVGALFSAAELAGREIDGEVLERASRHGAEEALRTLQQLGFAGEACADAVDRLLASWAERLVRLSLGEPDPEAE
jgi:hypothetical protein